MAADLSRDVFGIEVLKNNHPAIRRIKRDTGGAVIHGNKFWKSTSLMVDYLNEFPPQNHWRILEVGCGWGISGIFCAQNYNAKVTALDADDSVFPFLQHHARLNGVKVDTVKSRYEKVTKSMLSEFDMVIGSDICFWDEMAGPLFNLINRSYQSGIKRVVMTDPGRPPFRNMAERCINKFDCVYDNWSVAHPYNTSGLVLDIG
jgi:predicted nicotinamide N-methyase